MALIRCDDVAVADWITTSRLPWQQLVTFGPAAFEAYARLRFLPDPAYPGQPEFERGDDAPAERERLRATSAILAKHTRTPNDCFFCLWDGWSLDDYGHDVDSDSSIDFPSGLERPKVVVPNRAFYLFRGGLFEFDDRGAVGGATDVWVTMPIPAFIWPADRAWCIARDVDTHFAGIGARAEAINELLAHPDLDTVRADPAVEQPHYD